MVPKLKVFTWSDGFHAFTVAASSRPKALEAWGSKQDLFATGLATQLAGGPDYEAALASPGDVITRGLAIDVGKISKARPKKAAGPPRPSARGSRACRRRSPTWMKPISPLSPTSTRARRPWRPKGDVLRPTMSEAEKPLPQI